MAVVPIPTWAGNFIMNKPALAVVIVGIEPNLFEMLASFFDTNGDYVNLFTSSCDEVT